MKPGINQWAFPSTMPLTDAISLAHRMGFQAFEVCVGERGPTPLDIGDAELAKIRRHADAEGVALHSVGCADGWLYPLSAPDPAIRDKGLDIHRTCLRIAQRLGADAVLVVPGVVTPEVAYDAAYETALESVRTLAGTAEQCRVVAAIENVWNRFLLSPLEMRDFIDQAESDYAGAYVDVGNVVAFGYPEQWLRILDERVAAVHMKDFRGAIGNINGFVMLLEGDVRWPDVVASLRAIGYDRALTAEYGPYTHSTDATLRHIATAIDTILGL